MVSDLRVDKAWEGERVDRGKDGQGKGGGHGRECGQEVVRGIMVLGWGGRALRGGEGLRCWVGRMGEH